MGHGYGWGSLNVFQRWVLHGLLAWARASIQRREETRFRRTLIFGYARRIFVAIGKRFQQQGLLHHQREIFFLTLEEVFPQSGNRGDAQGLQALAGRRAAELERWRTIPLPRRIITRQSIPELERQLSAQSAGPRPTTAGGRLKGTVAARAAASAIGGTALVLPEFTPHAAFGGKILVTRQTDPGWTIVFPLLKGLVVERGGLLSHAAIVARELNLPCIVGVEDATALIPDGCDVELDLSSGEVRVLTGTEDQPSSGGSVTQRVLREASNLHARHLWLLPGKAMCLFEQRPDGH